MAKSHIFIHKLIFLDIMVRKYKRKTPEKIIDDGTLAKALKDVLENEASVRKAAAAYGINRSQLFRKVQKAREKDALQMDKEEAVKFVKSTSTVGGRNNQKQVVVTTGSARNNTIKCFICLHYTHII